MSAYTIFQVISRRTREEGADKTRVCVELTSGSTVTGNVAMFDSYIAHLDDCRGGHIVPDEIYIPMSAIVSVRPL